MANKDPMELGRRSGLERRGDENDKAWAERRSNEERRAEEDRRGIFYSVRYTNPQAIEKLREWLQEHCTGAFEIAVPDDLAELRKWGNYRVKFEDRADRTKLARLLGVHWPKWMG
ncbi:MAG: hypothetical protein VW709_17590 [Rickettsiales bacterium]